jgi:hypothetical protein
MMSFVATAIAGVLVWLITRWLLGLYRAYRGTQQSGRDWQEYRKRLPQWVTSVEQLFWVGLWLGITFALVVSFEAVHAVLRSHLKQLSESAFGVVLFASLFMAITPAALLSNYLSSVIGPLRRANLAAFSGFQATSFRSANAGLLKAAAVITPVCLIAVAIAVYDPWGR